MAEREASDYTVHRIEARPVQLQSGYRQQKFIGVLTSPGDIVCPVTNDPGHNPSRFELLASLVAKSQPVRFTQLKLSDRLCGLECTRSVQNFNVSLYGSMLHGKE